VYRKLQLLVWGLAAAAMMAAVAACGHLPSARLNAFRQKSLNGALRARGGEDAPLLSGTTPRVIYPPVGLDVMAIACSGGGWASLYVNGQLSSNTSCTSTRQLTVSPSATFRAPRRMVLKIIPGRKDQHWWFEVSRVVVPTKTAKVGTSLIDHASASGSYSYRGQMVTRPSLGVAALPHVFCARPRLQCPERD
jgi:hypothetical protein